MTVAEIGAVIKAQPDKASFKAAENSMKGMGSSLGAFAKKALKVAALAALPAKALQKGFQRVTSIDDAKAKLQGLGYVGKEFTEIMKAAKDSVTDTAFGMDEAATSAANLMSSGMKLEQLSDVMKQVANTAALGNVGMVEAADIFQDAYAVGKVSNDTLDRLALKGVPILKAFEKQLGKTQAEIKDMAKNGQISFEDLIEVMQSSDFKNAATEMGDLTLSGTLKNLASDIGKVGAAFLGLDMETNEIKKDGLFSWMKEIMPEVRLLVKSFIPAATELGSAIGKNIVKNLHWLKEELNGLHGDTILSHVKELIGKGGLIRERIKEVFTYLKWLWSYMKPIFGIIGTYLAVGFKFINDIIERLGGLDTVLKWVTKIAVPFFAMFTVSNKLTEFITWAKEAQAALKAIGKAAIFAKLKTMLLLGVLALIAFAIEDVYGFLNGKDSVTGDLCEKLGIDPEDAKKKITEYIDKVKEFVTKAGAIIGDFFDFVKRYSSDCISNFELWLDVAKQMITGIGNVWDKIKSGDWKGAVNDFADMNIKVTTDFQGINANNNDIVDAVKEFKQNVENDLNDTASTTENKMGTTSASIKKGFDDMKSVVTEYNGATVSETGQSLDKTKALYDAGLNSMLTTTNGKMSAVSNSMKQPATQSKQWGYDLADGFANGVIMGTNPVLGAVSNLAKGIKELLHFSEPDKGPLADFHNWMPDFMHGLADDIKNNKHLVVDEVESLAKSMEATVGGARLSTKTIATATTNNVSKSVNQNVNISNSYSGSTPQVVKNVSKGMNKSATDATTQMARALAYSR